MTRFQEALLASLLGHRFDDGRVYLQSRHDRRLLKQARRMGLVNADGFLTAAGQRFWTQQVQPLTMADDTAGRGERPQHLYAGAPH